MCSRDHLHTHARALALRLFEAEEAQRRRMARNIHDALGQALTAFALGHPVPNPCISSTQVSYSVPAGGLADDVSLAVYDLAGRRIRTLVGSDAGGNPGLVSWDCRNDRGQPVPSGVYFIQLNWNRKHLSERVVLIR